MPDKGKEKSARAWLKKAAEADHSERHSRLQEKAGVRIEMTRTAHQKEAPQEVFKAFPPVSVPRTLVYGFSD